MKKIFLLAFIAIVSFGEVKAQKGVLNGGFNVGLPTGDSSDFSSFTLGAELNYMYPIAEGFTLGPSVQYSHFFGKEYQFAGVPVDGSDLSFLPISGAARFNVTDKFVLGANIGYALGLNEGNDGGFYYRPVAGFKIGESSQLNISYSGISNDGSNANNISLGFMFGL